MQLDVVDDPGEAYKIDVTKIDTAIGCGGSNCGIGNQIPAHRKQSGLEPSVPRRAGQR
jgi:hypothetical protein